MAGQADPIDNFAHAVDADLNANGGANNWVHIAYTWDKNDTSDTGQKLFINGQLASAKANSWVDPPATLPWPAGMKAIPTASALLTTSVFTTSD